MRRAVDLAGAETVISSAVMREAMVRRRRADHRRMVCAGVVFVVTFAGMVVAVVTL